jgi:protein transport protein SEC61 subunit gamma and related proteins
MSDQVQEILDIPRDFFRDGAFFLNRCTKPTKKGNPCPSAMLMIEFLEISRAVAVGFLVMGFIGFAVKLVHIPINNILVWIYIAVD